MPSPNVFLDIVPYETAFQWRNDPKIYRWCRQHTTRSIQQHNQYWSDVDQDPTTQFYGVYAVDGTGGTNPVGVAGFTSINLISRTAEFSLYISSKNQRRGYAKQALLELFARGFHEFGFNRIWGETFEDNRARRLFNEIGMVEEGMLRESYFKDGKMVNSYIISILRREWDVLHPAAYLRHVLHNTSRCPLSYT